MAASVGFFLGLSAMTFAQDIQPKADNPQRAPDSPAQATKPAIPPETSSAPRSGSGSAAAAAPAAAAGKGHIVFFRPTRLNGAFYTYHIVEVGDDGKPAEAAPHLGDLPNGGAFIVDVEPGIHAYNITGPLAVNKAEDRLRIEIEPDETYYVEQTVRVGLLTSGFRLAPADEARFTQSHAKIKPQ